MQYCSHSGSERCKHGRLTNEAVSFRTGGIVLTCGCCKTKFGWDRPGRPTLCGYCRGFRDD